MWIVATSDYQFSRRPFRCCRGAVILSTLLNEMKNKASSLRDGGPSLSVVSLCFADWAIAIRTHRNAHDNEKDTYSVPLHAPLNSNFVSTFCKKNTDTYRNWYLLSGQRERYEPSSTSVPDLDTTSWRPNIFRIFTSVWTWYPDQLDHCALRSAEMFLTIKCANWLR